MKVELSKREMAILLSSMSAQTFDTLKSNSMKLDWIKEKHKGENLKETFHIYEKLKRLYCPEFYENM